MQTPQKSRNLKKLVLTTSITCAAIIGGEMGVMPTHGQTTPKPAAKKKPAAKANVQAEVAGPAELTTTAPKGRATTNPQATTTVAATKVIDLREFTKLNPLQTLDDAPTLIFYSAKGNVASAMAFFDSELSNAGWKEVPSTTPDNPQYRDELYTKSGYYLRVNVGESADEGQVSVNLTNLGNVDLSKFPVMAGARFNEYTTPVNATFETEQGMREAVKFCREELAKLGWREYAGMHPPAPEVPHVKQFNVFQNGVRVMVNVIRDPRLPSGNKTMVSYMAQHVLPHDFPIATDATEIKLDLYQNQAEYLTASSIEKVVQFYRDQANALGWTAKTESERVSDTAATLFMADEEKSGFVIAIRPTEAGPIKVRLERISFEKSSADDNELADSDAASDAPDAEEQESVDASQADAPDPTDVALQRMQDQIKKAVNKELQGVESELGDLGVPADVMSLVEEAKRLANDEGDADDESDDEDADEEEDEDDEEDESSTNAQVARELAEKQAAADKALASLGPLKTGCVVTLGDAKYDFKQALALRSPEDGSAVLMFSESPLNAGKAQRMLAQGKVPSIHDLMGSGFPGGMEIRLQDNMTWIGCFVDGNSINRGSSDFKTDFLAGSQRVRGTVTAEPDEVFDKKFVFEATFDLPLLAKDATTAASPGTATLVADAAYDLPVPEGSQGVGTEKTPYTSIVTTQHEASIADLSSFYRQELKTKGYQENAAQSKTSAESASLQFASAGGPAILQLKRTGDATEIQLTTKDQAKAKRDGIVPAAGQGLLLVANGSPQPITVALGKSVQKVPAGKGRDNPKDAFRVPVLPGKHRIKVEMGGETKNEEITIDAGTTWGLFAVPEIGTIVQQIY